MPAQTRMQAQQPAVNQASAVQYKAPSPACPGALRAVRSAAAAPAVLFTALAMMIQFPQMCAASANLKEPDATPGYNTKIPSSIMTPDQVQTRFGTLNFFDGMPDASTTRKMYETLDLVRGIDTFLDLVPMASLESMRAGHVQMGAVQCNEAIIFDKLMDSDPLFLTGNTGTVYVTFFIDLERDGPTALEVPAKMGPGSVNDAYFRFVVDTGSVGLDRGMGGKYLILPPNYTELDPPEGGFEATVDGETYFVAKSRGFVNWVILRGFLVDGKPDFSTRLVKDGLKAYPLSRKVSPPHMKWISGSRKSLHTVHSNTFKFYEEIWQVLQKEPVDLIDAEIRGRAASIGMMKGSPFEPGQVLKDTLVEAVALANAMARSIAFRPRAPEAYKYENSSWYSPFIGGSYKWLWDEGRLGRNQDARLSFFYLATLNTPAMVLKMVGKGSQYALISTDSNKLYFDGRACYKLTLPKDVPAKDFWSVVIYDPQTRSELQTSVPFPSKNSLRDTGMIYNADGSIDLYIAPKAPAGKETNWIESVPGKSWFALLRLYGPVEAWFDKTWRPSEIMRV
ncbi:unnamed protein product [Polarella glacialis]|uniref:DUF1254 domain-containing protein n=1 Tax=Polarella glacialis TaxID=89957 RepID=A0A813FYM9_POLGL|nr:unnamed protein product [Polarella glacialis]